MEANNIIVAWDFSDSSEAALQLATSLARDTGAVLHIVHVKEPLAVYNLGGEYGDVSPLPEPKALKAAFEKVVPSDRNVKHRHWLFTSEQVAKEIMSLADDLGADLIMMGTHGRTGLPRLLVGSVAESVIRQARCPVMTVRHPRLGIVDPTPGLLPS